MNVNDYITQRVFKEVGLIKLNGNPYSERLTYINDQENIRISSIRANKMWYLGNGDELLNWYTNQQIYGWAKNPIYNRNKRQYFWGRSVAEMVKRIHSGVPKAIIDTLSNIIGSPVITCPDTVLNEILKKNNYDFILTQQARPLSSVEGDGCFKINMNPLLSKYPLIEFYSAEDWFPIVKSNILVGIAFKSYYKTEKDKDFVLFEIRALRKDGLAIEYALFRAGRENEIIPCELKAVPELANLTNVFIPGCKRLLATPLKYYYDPLNNNRGKSLFDGKLDLFDLLDEILTQAGQTNRVSTPVEYYPVDLLERTKHGAPMLPSLYNRQYVKIEATPDGDGNINNEIKTTQPDLNFDKYMSLYSQVLSSTLIGLLSPSSLGFDVAKKDNAEAQREKEKQSIFTRNTMIKVETDVNVDLCTQLLMCYYNNFEEKDYQISVKYDEFASPGFENKLQVYGPAWIQGEISTDRYVSLLWADRLSEEEIKKEIEWLEENKAKDDFDLNDLMERGNEVNNGDNLQQETQAEEETENAEE